MKKKCINFWIHSEFLIFKNKKMSKSNKCLTLSMLQKVNISPLHYRYFCLNSHYRSQLFFKISSLVSAKKSFESFKSKVIFWKRSRENIFKNRIKLNRYKKEFWSAIYNDMNTPLGLSVLWNMSKDKDLTHFEKLYLAKKFDLVFGFGVNHFFKNKLSEDNLLLLRKRDYARKDKNYQLADKIRVDLFKKNIGLRDRKNRTDWYLI